MQKKKGRQILAVIMATMMAAQSANAASWVQDYVGWWWQDNDNSYPVNQWREVNGAWYWFDDNGYMATGWKEIRGAWYWFDDNGYMATGWKEIRGAWYWLDENGAMATGWKEIGGAWYWLDENGAMATGWKEIGGAWYYLEDSGAMATGWKEIGGAWYYLEDSGVMATTKWIGSYYVQVDGTMATDKWIGSYYVDASGLWIKTETEHDWQNYTLSQTKYGYACNWCYKDITDYDDYYDCHMSFHTHIFYLFPSYYVCANCGKLQHRHNWTYKRPTFWANSDEIAYKGYWKCWGCGHQSADGVNVEPILVSDEGYEYGAIGHWTTPFNFEKDSNEWIIEDEYWQPADDRPHIDIISIKGRLSMAPGDTYQYNVSFTPANPVEGKEVTWESSDPDVVSIDENGYATALKIGTATITATSSRRTATCFIRVTEVAVGHVKSATLLIGGQSEADGSLKIKKGRYMASIQTDPEQATYDVSYQIEQNDPKGYIARIVGSSYMLPKMYWEDGISYTDSETEMSFWDVGTVVVTATVTDINGNRFQLSQEVIIE